MNTKEFQAYFSDFLKRFPSLWRFAVRIHGVRSFDPLKFRYVKKFPTYSDNFDSGSNFEIIFDAQCLQTPSLGRGIGRYSLKFIEAVCKEKPNKLFAAVLTNVASPKEIVSAHLALESLGCPNLSIIILDPFKGSKKISMVEAQQNLLLDFNGIDFNCVIVLSSFQKPESVVSLALPKKKKYKRVAVFYDLIPMQFSKHLLISNWQKTSYAWALNSLADFELLLSISHESKQHWADLVSADTKIEVIHGGISPKESSHHKKFNERSGILCVGAEQAHKNVNTLLEAYIQLPEELQLKHDLILVGINSVAARKTLSKRARSAFGNVQITEYLDEATLNATYEDSRILVMPSLVEGLSLPILEAWSHGLLAIGGFDTVAEELIANHSLLFNPRSSISVRDSMAKFLESEENWSRNLESSMLRNSIFTWGSTANLAIEAIKCLEND